MDRYIVEELQQLVCDNFPMIDASRQGITGHSMGGHGALTLHLKNPQLYRSASAFSPIVNPSAVPWGQKAFSNYLGKDESTWKSYDATELVAGSPSQTNLLIDTGDADPFLKEHLQPERFLEACKSSGQSVNYRMQPGYDHSYYFVSSFIAEHLQHHHAALSN